MTDDDGSIRQWLDSELPGLVAALDEAADGRWRILLAIAFLSIGSVAVLSALLSYAIAELNAPTFIIAFGLLIGPGILGIVYAYLTIVRNNLHYRFSSDIVVPFLRRLFDEFRYDSMEGLDPEDWLGTGWFADDAEYSSATHRTQFRVDGRDILFCHLRIDPPTSMLHRLRGGQSQPQTEGLFAVVEDIASPADLDPPDLEGLKTAVDDDTLTLFMPAHFPELHTDPRTPVTDTEEVRQYLQKVVELVEIFR